MITGFLHAVGDPAQRKRIIIHLVLLVVLLVWMIPEVYMFTMAVRTPAQVFDPSFLFGQ